MAATDGRRRSRSGRLLDAALWGFALGAAGGAVLGAAVDAVGAVLGAVIGVAVYAPAEVLTTLDRPAAQPKPLLQRILGSVLLMALFGALIGLVLGPDRAVLTGVLSGGLLGLLGLRPVKVALGLVVGAAVGAVLHALDASVQPALVAAAVTLVYRLVAAVVYRDRPLVAIMAEEVPASELRYVVPFEARSRYVAADYVEQLAHGRGGTYPRTPPTTPSHSGPVLTGRRRGRRPRTDLPNRTCTDP